MEKYGFVYIWYDKKHKRYYVGCHWGTEDDGYICSSRWMIQSYKRRPQDFKRKVVSRIFSNRRDMFIEEYRWLSMIDPKHLKKRYYNFSLQDKNHWAGCENKTKSVSEKISTTLKEKHKNDPDFRARYEESHKNRSTEHLHTPEVIAKRAATLKSKTPDSERYVPSVKGSEEHKQKLSAASNKRWSQPGAREQQSKVSSEFHKGKQHRLGHKNTPEQNAKIAESHRGKKRSLESRSKMSEAAKKRSPPSEETLRKRSAAIKESWNRRRGINTLYST